MAFTPFVRIGLIQTNSESCFTKPTLSPSIKNDYPRPATIFFAGNNNSCQQEDPSFHIGLGTKRDLPSPTSQEKLAQHVAEPAIRCLRTQFTAYQRRELEKTFSQSQYISPQKRQSLSQQLGISNETIQTWFKNRRVKWRKEQRQSSGTSSASTRDVASTNPYFYYFGHVPYPNSKQMMRDARMLFGKVSAHAPCHGRQ